MSVRLPPKQYPVAPNSVIPDSFNAVMTLSKEGRVSADEWLANHFAISNVLCIPLGMHLYEEPVTHTPGSKASIGTASPLK